MMTTPTPPVERFLDGYSCSQTILTTYCQRYGVDHLTGVKMAAGFGAGMQKAETCGAVTGGVMVLGLHFGDDNSMTSAGRKPVYSAVIDFMNQFEALHGTVSCGELLGCDVNTPEGMQTAVAKDLFKTVCPKFVKDAAMILDRMLESA